VPSAGEIVQELQQQLAQERDLGHPLKVCPFR